MARSVYCAPDSDSGVDMNLFTDSGFKNVWILAISNALAASTMAMMALVGSLVGAKLAPSADWATLPIALLVVGTAFSIVPATRCMQRMGRKNAFFLFMALSFSTCWLASYSLSIQSFSVFCIACLLLGTANAALQQTRFAAMECVAPRSSSTAASMIMGGGIIAAVLGPELAVMGIHLSEVDYQGSFWLGSLTVILGAILLSFYRPGSAPVIESQASSQLGFQWMKNPSFCLAIASGVVAYVVMSFVMTGTPISMHHMHSHSLADTKWVIQSHIAAMFLPSFIAPLFFRLLGIKRMMLVGLLCYALTIVIGSIDTSVNGFWFQLVLLGIGWNFLFVSGTALLPSTYEEKDKYKAQAINDVTVFSAQAIASLSAGWAISLISWKVMLLVCLFPMLFLLAILIWQHIHSQREKALGRAV